MINHEQFHLFATDIILRQRNPNQIQLRRAVSALYYGLFHDLTARGASVFLPGGNALAAQAARAFDHRLMAKVCEAFAQPRTGPLPSPLGGLVPGGPGQKLMAVARTFITLQKARHDADYDLTNTISRQDALDLLRLARSAHHDLHDVADEGATMVFLASLLLNDRWTRRG